MSNEELHELVGAYLLGALDDSEFAEFEAHLDQCTSCLAEVDLLQPGLGALLEADAEPLSEELLARVMAVAGDGAEPATVPDHANEADSAKLSRRMLAMAAGVMLIAGAAALVGLLNRDPSLVDQVADAGDAAELALVNEAEGTSATLISSPGLRAIAFVGQDFVQLSPGEHYALWRLRDDGGVSFLGFVADEDQIDVDQAWQVDTVEGAGFALSIEQSTEVPDAPSEQITYVGTR